MSLRAIDMSRVRLPNVLKNVVGVPNVTWGTAPADIANLTDENDATHVTAGSTVIAATSGGIGEIRFDLGGPGNYLITHKVGLKSTTGTIFVYVESSPDNLDYTAINYIKLVDIASTTEKEVDTIPAFSSKRYLRLRYFVSGATNPFTCAVRPIDLRAFRLG